MRCVLWNRLIVLALTLAALAFSAAAVPNLLLSIACSALMVIVGIEQVTVRRAWPESSCNRVRWTEPCTPPSLPHLPSSVLTGSLGLVTARARVTTLTRRT